MKYGLVGAVALCLGAVARANAATCNPYVPPSDQASTCMLATSMGFCESYGSSYYYKSTLGLCYKYQDCDTCSAGFVRMPILHEPCGITYYGCECICSNCESDTSWTAAGPGYEKRTSRYCECSSGQPVCEESNSYRCAIGYYGNRPNGTSGCTRCPSESGIYGTTASAGTKDETGCYLLDGTKGDDITGSWEISGGQCFYAGS